MSLCEVCMSKCMRVAARHVHRHYVVVIINIIIIIIIIIIIAAPLCCASSQVLSLKCQRSSRRALAPSTADLIVVHKRDYVLSALA